MSMQSGRHGEPDENMDRVTLRMPTEAIEELDDLEDEGVFPNRSEAIRDAVRRLLNDYE